MRVAMRRTRSLADRSPPSPSRAARRRIRPRPIPRAPGAPALTYYQDTAPIFACALRELPLAGQHRAVLAPHLHRRHDLRARSSSRRSRTTSCRRCRPTPRPIGCPQIDDARVMPDDERDKLIAWVDGGSLAGDADARRARAARRATARRARRHLRQRPRLQLARSQGADEYRCFVIDPALTATFNLIAVGVHVDQSGDRAPHHRLRAAAADKAAVDALDAADPLPGYECFGGAGWAGAIERRRRRRRLAAARLPQRLGRAAARRHALRRAGALQLRQRPRPEPHRGAGLVGPDADADPARPVDGQLHLRHPAPTPSA